MRALPFLTIGQGHPASGDACAVSRETSVPVLAARCLESTVVSGETPGWLGRRGRDRLGSVRDCVLTSCRGRARTSASRPVRRGVRGRRARQLLWMRPARWRVVLVSDINANGRCADACSRHSIARVAVRGPRCPIVTRDRCIAVRAQKPVVGSRVSRETTGIAEQRQALPFGMDGYGLWRGT